MLRESWASADVCATNRPAVGSRLGAEANGETGNGEARRRSFRLVSDADAFNEMAALFSNGTAERQRSRRGVHAMHPAKEAVKRGVELGSSKRESVPKAWRAGMPGCQARLRN